MPITSALFTKVALSSGSSALSKIFAMEGPKATKEKSLLILNSITGGVASSFLHQYSDKIDFKGLGRFLTDENGGDYQEINHSIEKLMIKSVGETYRYLRETYTTLYETHKGDIAFLKELEKQANARPNDQTDYKLIAENNKKWLEENQSYAWQFAEEFIVDSKYNTADLHLDYIKEFVETHFEHAYDVAFNEGLKDPSDEMPYKAFIMKTLNGLGVQIKEGNTEILKRIDEIETNGTTYLKEGRNYLDKVWVKKDEDFKETVLDFLSEISTTGKETNEIVKELKEIVKPTYPHTLTAAPPRIDLTKYVERGTFLEDLHKDLEAGNNALFLNGLGGVGKSTLAAVYVQKYGGEYDHIAWLSQTDTFENMLLSAKTLHDSLELSMEGIDAQNLAPTIFNAMKKVSGKKLLVLDNVDQRLKDFKSILPSDYRLLLTSREKIGLGFTEKVVGKLNLKEAKELIEKHILKTTPTENEIVAFCELVDYHTLSIELLIKTLEESFELESLSNLTSYLKANKLDAEELQEKVFTNHSKEEVAVYAHLIQSFTLAKLEKKEVWILLQFAVLPPIIHAYKDLVEWLRLNVEDKKAFSNDLKNLAKKGWLEREGNSFSMHRMVQKLVKYQEKPKEDNTKELIETFGKKLYRNQTFDNPVLFFKWMEYGKFIYGGFESPIFNESGAMFANSLGLVLTDFGDFNEAKKIFEDILKWTDKNYENGSKKTAIVKTNLANVFRALGRFQESRDLLEIALESYDENSLEDKSEIAYMYLNLGITNNGLGELGLAKEQLEIALKYFQENFRETEPIISMVESNLGIVLKNLCEFDLAKELLEKALKNELRIFGEGHPRTSVIQANLASVLIDVEDYSSAETLLNRALHSVEKNYGPKHPETISVQICYSNLMLETGSLENARELLEKALKSAEVVYEEGHPAVLNILSNLGILCLRGKDFRKAKEILIKAVLFSERNHGKEHHLTSKIELNLAMALKALGEYDEAKVLLENSIEAAESTFGVYNMITANRYFNFGTLLDSMDDPCLGLIWCAKAFKICDAIHGSDHSKTNLVKSWVDGLTEKCKKQKPQSLD